MLVTGCSSLPGLHLIPRRSTFKLLLSEVAVMGGGSTYTQSAFANVFKRAALCSASWTPAGGITTLVKHLQPLMLLCRLLSAPSCSLKHLAAVACATRGDIPMLLCFPVLFGREEGGKKTFFCGICAETVQWNDVLWKNRLNIEVRVVNIFFIPGIVLIEYLFSIYWK